MKIAALIENRTDPLARIPGQEHAKRALEVALAGGHSILFCGPPLVGCGEQFRDLARTLDLSATHVWPCPCGRCMDYARECFCDPNTEQWKHYRLRLQQRASRYDIVCEVPRLIREIDSYEVGETLSTIEKRAFQARKRTRPKDMNQYTKEFLDTTIKSTILAPHRVKVCMELAQTIAALDSSDEVEPEHFAEAFQYVRPFSG